jgi:acetyl-CoA acyltransferase
MPEVYIISALRTPVGIGKPDRGLLFPVAPVDLAAHVLVGSVERAGVPPERIDDVIMGCVTPIGDQGANIARLASLQAGLPVTVPGVQINRMCGSSQQAIHFATQAILAGDMDVVVAGGIEMMSHQPLGADYPEHWPEDFPYRLIHQGLSAEMMAEKWDLNRDELDDYAYKSHCRAGEATACGGLEAQILPVRVADSDGAERMVTKDQGVRYPPNREKMAALPPVFKEGGVITAGNASQISDGAGAAVLASARGVQELGLEPLARVVSRAVVGTDPVLMLDGPIHATREILRRSGLGLDRMDVIEVNEAFASVVLAWAKELGADLERTNPEGGAIAHGHPLGATGAILMAKLVDELRRRAGRYGLQTMCIGHGMGTATIIERC